MKRKAALMCALVVVGILAFAPVDARAASGGKTLKVKLSYTGTEKVDPSHKIYVLLFDANPFTSTQLVDWSSATSAPAPEAGVCHILRREAASGRNQQLTFNNLGASSVYAMAFLDKSGNYDPHSDPPSGAPTAMYGKSKDKPEQIKLKEGKTVKVVLAFDDSHKLP
jgi:hypothetical protein